MRLSPSCAAAVVHSRPAPMCDSGNCVRARNSSGTEARKHRMPVIAAVHGYVLGLALGLMLECDLIVAEAGTKLQVTEAPRGLSGAKYWALLNFRGAGAFGTDIALTGRFFTAEEAHAAGVIERVAPAGQLM